MGRPFRDDLADFKDRFWNKIYFFWQDMGAHLLMVIVVIGGVGWCLEKIIKIMARIF
jgi:hypothetical protein